MARSHVTGSSGKVQTLWEAAVMSSDLSESEKGNRAFWDEVAPVHRSSYDIESLLKGISLIDDFQKREFYPVEGKDLIHLQCHIGTDTLSLALDGARVTGVDFSHRSIEIARELAGRLNVEAEFIEANVLDLPAAIQRKYDVVYTSKGVLPWIGDIGRWAKSVSHLLAPGGVFYLLELHPVLGIFDDTRKDALVVRHGYFHRDEPDRFDDDHPDYSDSAYIPASPTFEWTWPISDVVNALVQNGLDIELLNEHDKLFYKGLPAMTQAEDGWWVIEGLEGKVPLAYSIRARRRVYQVI
jgi:2-polyprenyl-3-methyl-5-hydroxy-6-metoxy-1,4-benzoquinol methylase